MRERENNVIREVKHFKRNLQKASTTKVVKKEIVDTQAKSQILPAASYNALYLMETLKRRGSVWVFFFFCLLKGDLSGLNR